MIIDEPNNNVFIFNKLTNLKNELNKDEINLKNIKRDIKQINEFNQAQNFNYLNDLLDPIKQKGTKIPSDKPIPSCSFQLHNYATFKTTAAGNDVFTLNPFFLSNEKIYDVQFNYKGTIFDVMDPGAGLYFFANTNRAIPGDKSITDWYYPDINFQTIPDIYSKYRVVSACCTLKYLGTLEEAQGVVGGGISYVKSPFVGVRFRQTGTGQFTTGTRNPLLTDYGNFELIKDSFYFQENLCLEGLKMLYFPLDNSFNEFKDVWDGKIQEVIRVDTINGDFPGLKISDKYMAPGFNWFIYILGAPYNDTRNFRLDWYINYECIPKAEFLNYMPLYVNINIIPPDVKQRIYDKLRQSCIGKLNNTVFLNK